MRSHAKSKPPVNTRRPLPNAAHGQVIRHVRYVPASLAIVGAGIPVGPDDKRQVRTRARQLHHRGLARIGRDAPGTGGSEAERGAVDVYAPQGGILAKAG